MSSIVALAKLHSLGSSVFQTSDAAACLGVSNETASKVLSRLAVNGSVVRLIRGRWALPELVEKLTIPEHLTAPWPSYISLHTALYYHGLITQIPLVTYAVSLSRPRLFRTSLGAYSIHQIKPDFFFGYDTEGGSGIKMATPEKALLDVLYLSPARSHLFKKLPEIELPAKFRVGTAREMIQKIQSRQRRTLVEEKFEDLLKRVRSRRVEELAS